VDQFPKQRRSRPPSTSQRVRLNDEGTLDDSEYDDVWPTRMPNSTLRYTGQGQPDVRAEAGRSRPDVQPLSIPKNYRPSNSDRQTSVPPRRTATDIPAIHVQRGRGVRTDDVETGLGGSGGGTRSAGITRRIRLHWFVFAGVAAIIMVIGWIAFSALASWLQVTEDDWHYGRPRTFQVNAVVGHNDSAANPSHFIALNLNRHIQIIEIPGGDATKAKIYAGPMLIGQGQDLTPVTLTFKDVNGDGKPDMIVNVQDSHFVYINENGAFRPARPDENIQL
jgi:hypothetical protein